MAKIIGAAGRYATGRSIRAFQRMLLTTMLFIAAIGVFEGLVLCSLFGGVHLSPVVAIIAEGAGVFVVWQLCRAQSRRVDRYEHERQTWRAGADGECAVAAVLDQLPDRFVVFHDFNTARGNFDHLVIGPTGIFAIETKNWRGTIGATEDGELTRDGAPASQSYVRQLTARIMAVREQVMILAGQDIFIKALMVFPKARVSAKFGTTRSVYCVREGKLCEQIENVRFNQRMTSEEVELFTRAFQGIAGMDADFQTAAVIRKSAEKRVGLGRLAAH